MPASLFVDALGMHPLTLKFHSADEEVAFIKFRRETLIRTLRQAAALVFLGSVAIHALARISWTALPEDHVAYYEPAWVAQYIYAGLSLAQLLVLSIPRLAKCIGDVELERLGAVVIILYMLLVLVGDAYTIRIVREKFFGDSIAPNVKGIPNDTYISLLFSSFLFATHALLPLRFLITLATEFAAAACFVFYTWVTGSMGGIPNLILFCFLVICFCASKRQLERTERILFVQYFAEKTLRVQAEFELSCTQRPNGKQTGDDVSAVTIGSTEALSAPAGEVSFAGLTGSIASIGKQEQWLIDEHELSISAKNILGQGHFGVVVVGSFHGTPVAVKITRNPSRIGSLLDLANELRIIRKLRHPNIVLFHGACLNLQSGDLFLVTELVHGEGMRDFIGGHSHGKEPNEAACHQISLGICRAVMYLHSRNPLVVHGDLKPENIIIEHRLSGKGCATETVRAKLLDFGLSRLLTSAAKPLGGTFRWAAPEVFSSKVAPSPQADVFSLGTVIFFAVSGRLPMAGLSKMQVERIARRGVLVALEWPTKISSLMGHCRQIIEHCRLVDPDSRAGVKEVYDVLMRWPADIDAVQLEPVEGVSSNVWEKAKILQESPPATRQNEALGPSAGKEIAPGVNNELQSAKKRLKFQELQPTMNGGMTMSLCHCLQAWNFYVPASRCCTFHAALNELRTLLKVLETSQCPQILERDPNAEVMQCSRCMLVQEANSSADFGCAFCGRGPESSSPVDSSTIFGDLSMPRVSL